MKQRSISTPQVTLKRVKDASAEGLTKTFTVQLDKYQVPTNQMVGFTADTCSVIFGSHKSVTKKLKEKVPALLTVKCTCHNSHLASSKSMAFFPTVLEDFIRQLPSCFSGYKNKDELAEFHEFCKLPQHAILKPGLTRWLSVQPCAQQIIQQFNALLFLLHFIGQWKTKWDQKMLSLS